MNTRLAIDFGTTYSAAAWSNDAGSESVFFKAPGEQSRPTWESMVLLQDDGQLVSGWRAANQVGARAAHLVRTPKRSLGRDEELPLGDRLVPVVDVVACVLKDVYSEANARRPQPPDRVVLTRPASWHRRHQDMLLEAARRAGISTEPELVTEPESAARYYSHRHPELGGGAVAVYDLGGGTFDAVVLVRSTDDEHELAGLPAGAPLGGERFDDLLLNHVREMLERTNRNAFAAIFGTGDPIRNKREFILRRRVRRAKEMLSDVAQVDVELPDQLGELLITRDELERLIRPDIEESVDLLEHAIDAAGVRDSLTGVFLVGGSSEIPLVHDTIGRRLGMSVLGVDDPKAVVARGAAESRLPSPPANRIPPPSSPSSPSATPLNVHLSATPAGGEVPLTVRLQAHVEGAAPDDVAYSWDFGHGDVFTGSDLDGSNPPGVFEVTFAIPGRMEPRVGVRHPDGREAWSEPVTVIATDAQASDDGGRGIDWGYAVWIGFCLLVVVPLIRHLLGW